jgi:hypothetical protein
VPTAAVDADTIPINPDENKELCQRCQQGDGMWTARVLKMRDWRQGDESDRLAHGEAPAEPRMAE